MKNEAIFSQRSYPALHALVHRYGIPSGVTLEQQAAAREELQSLLIAAQEVGYAQGRGHLNVVETDVKPVRFQCATIVGASDEQFTLLVGNTGALFVEGPNGRTATLSETEARDLAERVVFRTTHQRSL